MPTDHWAFDAIAELAAKGIVEGYPDGTFKGDRAMTRYEMAMVVARLLARVEAIKIPPPAPPAKIPAPPVSAADIATLRRLVNEFRAELAALGVRVTAVEEELAALRARIDNTFITGDWFYAYVTPQTGGSGGVAFPEVQRNRVRLTFRGRVGSHVAVFLRARWNSTFRGSLSSTTDFDRIFLDYSAPFGVVFRVGREYWTLGPQGLLLLGLSSREGARASMTFGPVALQALAYFSALSTSGTTYGVRGQMQPLSGWTFGFNYRSDRDWSGTQATAWNAAGTYTGSGWSADWNGNIIPGLSFTGEYAIYTPTAGCPAAGVVSGVQYGCSALWAALGINLASLTGMTTFAPSANIWYKSYRADYRSAGQTNTFSSDRLSWLGSNGTLVTAWGADLSLNIANNTSALIGWEGGRANMAFTGVAQGEAYTSLMASVTYQLGHNGSVAVEYHSLRNSTTATAVEQLWALILRSRW